MSFRRLANRARQCGVLAGLTLTLVLAGCGGGGGGSSSAVSPPVVNPAPPPITQTQVGYFVDGPVVNLQYSALPSGLSGTTDLTGAFSFKAGDTVTFSFGGIALGSTKPANSLNGAIIVTPLALTGETDPSNSPKAAALTALINTLDAISFYLIGPYPVGTQILPVASNAAYTLLVADLVSLGNPQAITDTQLQPLLYALYGTKTNGDPNVQAVSNLTGQTLVTQATAGAGLAGTVWKGTVTDASNLSTPWYAYFSPDGTAYVFSGNGQPDNGIWSVVPNGSISVFLSTTTAVALGNFNFQPSATAITATILDSTNLSANVTIAASEVIAATAQATTYTGPWHASLSPVSAGPAATTALILVDAAGQLHGVTSDHQVLSGTVDLTTGVASATSSAAGVTLSLNFATLTGTESSNSAVQDNLTLTHAAGF